MSHPIGWSVRIFSLAVAALAAAVPALSRETPRPSTFTVPWGDGEGKLTLDLEPADALQESRGPGAFRALPGGGVAILDTLAGSVEVFGPGGVHERTLPHPRHDDEDAEVICADLERIEGGGFLLLNLADNSLMRLEPGVEDRPRSIPLSGLSSQAMPVAIARAPGAGWAVLDGWDGSVLVVDDAGKTLRRIADPLASSLVLDAKGAFYNVRPAGPEDLRRFEVVRFQPPAPPARIGTIETGEEIVSADLFGLDAAGNAYVAIETGTIETPDSSYVYRFSPDGRASAAPAPPASAELPMPHSKSVAPDGTVLAVRFTQQGLEVVPVVFR